MTLLDGKGLKKRKKFYLKMTAIEKYLISLNFIKELI